MYDNFDEADGIGITDEDLNKKLFIPTSLQIDSKSSSSQGNHNDTDAVPETVSLIEVV